METYKNYWYLYVYGVYNYFLSVGSDKDLTEGEIISTFDKNNWFDNEKDKDSTIIRKLTNDEKDNFILKGYFCDFVI
jgi:hypothetical protein